MESYLFLSAFFSLLLVVDGKLLGAAEPIKIGVVLCVTGRGGFLGTPQKEAITVAVEEVNRQGGIFGRPIELYIEDDQSNPTNSAVAATKLIERDKVSVLMRGFSSPSMIAYQQVVNRAGIPCLQSVSVLDAVTLGSQCTFNTGFTLTQQADEFARLMPKQRSTCFGTVGTSFRALKRKIVITREAKAIGRKPLSFLKRPRSWSC
jgi:ABC-type branched-subunit amino acid transport system substrate-binding protein